MYIVIRKNLIVKNWPLIVLYIYIFIYKGIHVLFHYLEKYKLYVELIDILAMYNIMYSIRVTVLSYAENT